MATKTITLELDAYEKLRRAKRSERESFSQVVRRAEFSPGPHTGAAILAALGNWSVGRDQAMGDVLEYLDRAHSEDSVRPRVSPSAWGEAKSGGEA